MTSNPITANLDAWFEAWRLKVSLIAVQALVAVLFAVLISPLLAVALGFALVVSGQPALADQDIAAFLLSPAGAIAGVLLAALFLASRVLGTALMLGVVGDARHGRTAGALTALGRVWSNLGGILRFAVGLILRVLGIALPFLAVAGGAALMLLTEFDINYYLSERPPEAVTAALIIGVAVLGMTLALIWVLAGWAIALPLVLSGEARGWDAFAKSSARMAGHRGPIVLRLVVWGAFALVLGALSAALFSGLARAGVAIAGDSLGTTAALLLVVVTLSALVNLVLGAISGGALADHLMDAAGWPSLTPADVPGLLRHPGLALAAVAVALVLAFGSGTLGLSAVKADHEVVVIAHRGGAIARPENTLAAFELGVEEGADWIEIDVQEDADGRVIVAHDSDFMKVAGNPMKVWEATEATLADVDIGGWFDPAYADQRTPTLDQALEVVRDRSGLLIELKYYGHDDRLAERIAARVEALGMDDQVAAMSLKYQQVQQMKAVRPDWQVGLLAATSLGRLWELDADFLAVNNAMANARFVTQAQAAGKPVYVWTVNDALSMSRAASLGVDGLITDAPALARKVVAEWQELSALERFVLSLADRLGLGAARVTQDQGDA